MKGGRMADLSVWLSEILKRAFVLKGTGQVHRYLQRIFMNRNIFGTFICFSILERDWFNA
jgi:hypothetical protein